MTKFEGREIVLKVVAGSHNYNLNTATSDKDYKIFITPTFDDLYYSRVFSFGEQSVEVDYTVHDVRKLSELLWKSNLNFLEVLFSSDVSIMNPGLKFLFDDRDKWSTMNMPAFYKATLGMHHMKMDDLFRGTATTKGLVEKFGYDTKQAHHALRCLYVVERMMEFGDLGKALRFENGDSQRDTLLAVKKGMYSLDYFRELVDSWWAKMGFAHHDEIPCSEPNENAKEELENCMYQFIKDNLGCRFK